MSNNEETCLVCGLPAKITQRDFDLFSYQCKRCGPYRTSGTILGVREGSPPDPDLSGVIRNHNEVNRRDLVTITSENYEILKSSAPEKTDIPSRCRYFLRYVGRRSKRPGVRVDFDPTNDCSVCFAADLDELHYYFQYAVDIGYIRGDWDVKAHNAMLTPKGWEEASRTPTLDSPNAFVAMCLSKDVPHAALLEKAFLEAIRPAVEDDAKYHVVRIDEQPFNTDIVFEIIARIKESRFVLADVTEHRNGVYFEGGFAMGMGLPVIWMCHEDDLKNAHFDTSHLNHIVWTDNLAKFRKDLANRVLATIGKGPRRTA